VGARHRLRHRPGHPRRRPAGGSGGALGWTWRRAQALAALRATITAHANTDGILYKSATWLIRARRA